jgi:hypothetical protein
MANLFLVTITTNSTREVRVAAANPEEAQAKVALNEGETVVSVADQGVEVIV